MTAKPQDRAVYIDALGNARCISAQAIAAMPSEFGDVLTELCSNLQLALDCIGVFGGVPTPVALAILRNIEPAHAAIDLAVRTSRAAERLAN
jgi:hypothetical protein